MLFRLNADQTDFFDLSGTDFFLVLLLQLVLVRLVLLVLVLVLQPGLSLGKKRRYRVHIYFCQEKSWGTSPRGYGHTFSINF